jgi:hypothetical protein
LAQSVSAFPAGINAAATWDLDLIQARGKAMGQEHRGKGVNVALGPMTNLGALHFLRFAILFRYFWRPFVDARSSLPSLCSDSFLRPPSSRWA